MSSKKSKRILVISDTHCGHESGLTPEGWQYEYDKNATDDFIKRRNKFATVQREMWNWYKKTIDSLGPIDILFHLGDCIDGKGEKSGSSELITADRNKQCEMAVKCINYVKAKEIILIYGTAYHSGTMEDFEDQIASKVGAKKIGSHEWIDVNGTIFDLRHHVGGSSVPYSKGTQISKQKLYNDIWAEKELQPNSNVLIRGHVHYDYFCGDSDWLGLTVPGLQWSNKYGVRRCGGYVSVGVTVFDVDQNGGYSWQFKIAKLGSQKVQTLTL